MAAVTEMGAVVMPPVPSFYAKPVTVDDVVNHTIGRALDLFDIDTGLVQRWGEPGGDGDKPVRLFRRRKAAPVDD
jgi:4-hydroxy-3-polyprenylbenzoate decarboxylase